MRHVIVHFWFLAMWGSVAFGQNLVPNPGFEDINRCIRYSALCSPEGWRNEYGYKARVTDTNLFSEAYQGSNFSIIEIWNAHRKEGEREFLQVPLICPLKRGHQYKISFYVKPIFFAVTRMGVYFSEEARCEIAEDYGHARQDSRWLLVNRPQVVFRQMRGIYSRERSDDRAGRKWLKLSQTYTASGEEKFMIIGNFQRKRDLDVMRISQGRHRNKSVYFIDEVSVTALNESALADCCYEANRQAIYADDIRHSCPNNADNYHMCDTSRAEQITVGVPFTMSNINFKVDEAELLPEAYPNLDSLVSYLKKHPEYGLKIHGHTDSVGGKEYNQQLSQARAQSVLQYLVDQGIDPKRLSARGFGYEQPVASNETPRGRRQNRRVEFYIE